MRIAGTTALVTGASSGIGAAVCRALAEAGASVAMVARRGDRLIELASALAPARTAAFACDVRDARALAETVAAIEAGIGPVDILVNNAGIGRYLAFLATSPEESAAILETNLLAALQLTRLVLPGMLERRRGHLVNVASIAGRIGSRNHSVYCASKFALAGLSESLAYELEGTGVGITLVNPGIIDTPFFDHQSFASFPARARARAIAPEAVAGAILHAVRRGRREVTIPRSYALGTVLKTVAPGLFRRLMQRFA